MTAAEIAATVAASLGVEHTGRDIYITERDAFRAQIRARDLGAADVVVRPSALFGTSVVTVWMD